MNALEVWAVYERIWREAEKQAHHENGETLTASYVGHGTPLSAGYFDRNDVNGNAFPAIRVVRLSYAPPSDTPSRTLITGEAVSASDLFDELCTLAHEYGHYLSWRDRRGTPEDDAYHAAVKRFDKLRADGTVMLLTQADRALIREEERRAWDGGRAAMLRHGFDDWSAFDARVTRSLDVYEQIFRGEGSEVPE